jgi:hypothetical protein
MSPGRRSLGFVVATLISATCSCANFAATYTGMGPANKAGAFAAQAGARFEASEQESSASALAEISKIDIYFDSVPEQLAVDGTTIGVREGAGAELLGSVLMMPQWYMPEQATVVPVLQRAVHAAGGNLAWCPREGSNWHCFILKTQAPASSSTPTPPAG